MGLIGKIVRKREQYLSMYSPSRYSKIFSDEESIHNNNHHKREVRRGYVPVLVGKCEEEEERFMVPLGWMKHPSIVDLLQLSASEFGYHQQGVIQIPCETLHFRVVMEKISSQKKGLRL
ncbi:auxin-responsive protein SAUR71-like [Chenopodium quinoa]|uniref:auxin-responsive protein SAUR71-like n=1 Tax=Chenopodium quinoa TaxID=63459 RepID=UPI000B78AC96|nr:auxin-responsive protein SAUR71-like [Chenopodium quinoa]